MNTFMNNELKMAFVAWMKAVYNNNSSEVVLERKKRYFELLHSYEQEWNSELLILMVE